jgi:hypothetical protein
MLPLTKTLTLLLVGTVLLFVGCGSSNPNPNDLNTAQAQQLSGEVFVDVFGATADAVSQSIASETGHKSSLLAVLPKDKSISSVPTPETISCSSSSCTITFTYTCLDGGSIAVSGSASESGSTASMSLTETPTSCSDGILVINGNPNVTVKGQVSDNGTTTSVSVSMDGDVTFSPVTAGQFPTGSCKSDLQINASVSDSTDSLTSCSISGSMCGIAMNQNCLP